DGVFYSLARPEKDWLSAVLIKGVIPNGVEVHLLDWSGDLYGKEIEVEVLEKIRDLKSFDKKEDLIKKIQEDIEKAKNYFKKYVHGNN
ncbi:MAG: riboflavin kinase, partial [Patescibacteria group bacterium]